MAEIPDRIVQEGMEASSSSAPAERRSHGPLWSIFGGSLGNLVEWYDWYVYSAFTLYFAPSFFPASR